MNIEDIQQVCKSFRGVEEDIKWEHNLCLMVGNKIFCIISLDAPPHVSFKTNEEEFEELTSREGIIPAPYLARAKWVTLENLDTLPPKEWKRLLRNSYDLIASKLTRKVRAELGIL